MNSENMTMKQVVDGDAETFRRLWRGFGSTVTLIATEQEGQRYAMLATAATSLSMDPPSLLICVNRSASAFPALKARGAFSLGILGHSNHDVAATIATASAAERFAHGVWHSLPAVGRATDGLPWLGEAQATLFCEVDTTFDYGTHTTFIARIDRAVGDRSATPLIYCDGAYGGFAVRPQQ